MYAFPSPCRRSGIEVNPAKGGLHRCAAVMCCMLSWTLQCLKDNLTCLALSGICFQPPPPIPPHTRLNMCYTLCTVCNILPSSTIITSPLPELQFIALNQQRSWTVHSIIGNVSRYHGNTCIPLHTDILLYVETLLRKSCVLGLSTWFHCY